MSIPRLVALLSLASPSGPVAVGDIDLSIAAAATIESNGVWMDESIPLSFDVLCKLGHAGRRAALSGRLTSPGLPARFQAFRRELHAWGDPAAYRRLLQAADDAGREAQRLSWLWESLRNTRYSPWPKDDIAVSHPLTEDIAMASQAVAWTRPPSAPFAFATSKAHFKGISHQELQDFVREGGTPLQFLSLLAANAEQCFTDIQLLDKVSSSSWEEAENIVTLWNSLQHAWMRIPDRSCAYLADGFTPQCAAAWCSDALRRAVSARDAIITS